MIIVLAVVVSTRCVVQQPIRPSYPELFYLGLYVTLREVLDVGQLEVHLSQPHQDNVSCRLKLLPLADEVLNKQTNRLSCFSSIFLTKVEM